MSHHDAVLLEVYFPLYRIIPVDTLNFKTSSYLELSNIFDLEISFDSIG